MSAADTLLRQPAHLIAAAVRHGEVTAEAMVQASLAFIESTDGAVNAFTDLTAARALACAQELDRRVRAGDVDTLTLTLLGVPYAVKNLFAPPADRRAADRGPLVRGSCAARRSRAGTGGGLRGARGKVMPTSTFPTCWPKCRPSSRCTRTRW